jgi:catechol 2,3-dioxygenase-like lactoylglutathione lyase family enzyme
MSTKRPRPVPSPSSATPRKAHVAIRVRNVPRSVEFYRRLFGVEPAKLRPGYAKFDVANPPLNFTLNQHPCGDGGGFSHLGIQVASTSEVLAVRRQWQERGLATRDEWKTECCYARQNKTWVEDPDGNQWEVFAVLEDHLTRASAPGNTCCAAPGRGPGGSSSVGS